jgi:exo-beta-1,3-glucanase (GH17 family)
VQNYLKAIKELKLDMRVMVGVKGDDPDGELKILWGAIGDDWALIDTIAVGNEVINNIPEGDKAKRAGKVAQLVAYVGKVKTKLVDSGHPEIPVVIVDTWVVIPGYIDICKHSDYLAVNVHPWFNPNQIAKDSGKFLKETVAARLKADVVDKGCSKPIRICGSSPTPCVTFS